MEIKKGTFILVTLLFLYLVGFSYSSLARIKEADIIQYSLRTNNYEYKNDEINEMLFHQILNSFSSDYWDFMVLSPDEPMNNNTFIQVGAPEANTQFKFTLETGFDDGKGNRKVYRCYIENQQVILQYVIDYWERQQVPDISFWEDVTHEMG